MFSSAKYWDSQLRAGHRLAAIGGSDNHNATTPPGEVGAIGWPATAVEADELSVPAILNGIRAGRTFIDLTASRDKMLDFEAEAEGASAKMGGTLHTERSSRSLRCVFMRLQTRDRWFTCCWTVRMQANPCLWRVRLRKLPSRQAPDGIGCDWRYVTATAPAS